MKGMARLTRALRRVSIPNLMTYIVGGMAVVYAVQLLTRFPVSYYLYLDRALVLRGEVWRLLTFVFIPPSANLLLIFFSLYFYWLIGSMLQNQWGTSRFTLFYLVGMLGAVLSAAITGRSDNTYLNLSLFLAFAAVYPEYQLMLFFVLPVKVKYLAIVDLAIYTYLFIVGGAAARVAILSALLNLALFFGGDFINMIRRESKYWKTRRNFRRAMRK